MLFVRDYKEQDESLILAVMTNQIWSDSVYKLPKQELRKKIRTKFYDYLYAKEYSNEENGFKCVVVCLEDSPIVVVGFSVVLSNCLISHFIKSEFAEMSEVATIIKASLKTHNDFDRFEYGFNRKFANGLGVARRVSGEF